jgi:sulfatase maturation enzyme AslB (radical SAM superfamily)
MTNQLNYGQWVQRLEALPVPTQQAIATALLERSLEVYINSTEQCNFRCRYCYEEFLT